ncbi:ketopantoate reductase family protein [Murinocardiopsis flavida]|uniref:ketopantoate reductase family protein n=1 Tax=Murinocardiopsis flavida TaxID=645275 RepID=UPI001FEA2D69|nr:2-dehydropantoate 2-reductase [Murinocardiopsis flavida]
MTHFTVLGPGGVGGLLAGLLARAGHDVTVVATEPTAERIAADGLRVDSAAFGDFTIEVAAEPELTRPTDVLIVAPKATALQDAVRRVAPEMVRGALVVPLLNGFEHMDVLRSAYPGAQVLAATIWVESTRVAPGHISQTSPFTTVELAAANADPDANAAADAGGAGPDERVDELAAHLRGIGFTTEVRDDEQLTLWQKVHFLMPTALVCSHAGAPIGVVRTDRRADLLGVMSEVGQVAARLGLTLDSDRVTAMADGIPPQTKPSMLRDREAGRAMEVDALGGAFLRAARRVGVDVPVTARIVADLERVDGGSAQQRP